MKDGWVAVSAARRSSPSPLGSSHIYIHPPPSSCYLIGTPADRKRLAGERVALADRKRLARGSRNSCRPKAVGGRRELP